ncbi:MAG: hypothetical protein A2Z88_05835 [Omnitrophica WOR_2 bacterium GWA2_47_8]|nr:MAG: hypothetical protein A2Z88_05835 [Omnitrophica WOR_2 bacterium GWA2_47_8]
MNFMSRLALLFYMTIVLFIGCFLLTFVLNLISYHDVVAIVDGFYNDESIKVAVLIIAITLLILNCLFAQIISGVREKQKNIAFDNPSGRVSVSLSAMEDLVRRLLIKSPEVKDSKIDITATKKKGLDIAVRLILKSDVNIPDLTAVLQEAISRKIHNTIALEGPVNVKIDVTKIVPESNPKSATVVEDDEFRKTKANIPFQGYRP